MRQALATIHAMAAKEISAAETLESLREIEKFYDKYFSEVNKFCAGKRTELPYVLDDGRTIV